MHSRNRYVVINGKARHLAGFRRSYKSQRPKLAAAGAAALAGLIADMRNVKTLNQSQVGTCVTNASCEGMELIARRGGSQALYSRLYLYYYARDLEGVPADEDSGLMVEDAISVLEHRGVCLETSWDYSNPETRFKLQPPEALDAEAAQHKVLFSYGCPTLREIKASIMQTFPVPFGFQVPNNMQTLACVNSGLVYFDGSNEGGHEVLACGFDDLDKVGDDVGSVLFLNSWGDIGMCACGHDRTIHMGAADCTGTSHDAAGNEIPCSCKSLQLGYFKMPYKFFDEGLASDGVTIRREEV